MATLTDETLDDLDARLQTASRTGDHSGLSVLGYGEVTTVIGVETPEGSFAIKGLPSFRSIEAARRHAACIERYTRALTALGVNVVDTDARLREQADGSAILYLVQPMLPPGSLGPQHFAGLQAEAVEEAFGRILATLRRSVTRTVTPDGQLSNWAFVDGQLRYLDVSTPFMLDEDGRPELDWQFFMDAHPLVLRPVIRAQLPSVVGKYHDLRVQLVDLLGNLLKEGMGELVGPLLRQANRLCDFERPITEAEIERYYAADARTFGLLLRLRRLDRWVRVKLLRRPYRVLIPPPFDRHPEATGTAGPR